MSVSRTNLLTYLQKVDYIKLGHVSADWDSILHTCETIAAKCPEYVWTAVPDESFEVWGSAGQNLKNALDLNRQYGYTIHNTQVWDTACQKPKIEMPWEQELVSQLPLDLATGIVIRETPGHTMPWHQDRYSFFKQQHNVTEFVTRMVVFVKDWQIGHFIQAGSSVISHWKAGDIITWHPDRWHLSVNAGIDNKWSWSITGILHENIDFQI